MPNLVHGQDPGGALRPIQVDDNGNLQIDLVSGVSVSTSITGTMTVDQLSGSSWSTVVNSFGTSIDVKQVSGSADSVVVNSFDTSLDVKQVSGSALSVQVNSFDTSILANQVSGANFSTEVSAVGRTTNPAAVSDAATVKLSADDLGRLVVTPYQVRDLLATAYVTTTTAIETTLLAAVAGANLDLVQIVAANTSDAIVDIDFRAVTAGNVEFSLTVPADSTAGFIPAVPWPQAATGNNWTMDVAGADISNTTVNVSALFIKNV